MSNGNINTLSALATYLQQQATPAGNISLDNSFLDARVLGLITSDLLRPEPNIKLSNVNPQNIKLSGDGLTLYVLKAKTPAIVADSFLNLTGVTVNILFTQTSVGGVSEFNFVMQVLLPYDWNFGKSFQKIAHQATDDLPLDGTPYFYFSTYVDNQPLPSFPAATADDHALSAETQALVKTQDALALVAADNQKPLATGLNYYANLDIASNNIFGLILTILGLSQAAKFPLYGVITQTQEGPTFDLHAYILGTSTVSFGFISAETPWAGVSVGYFRIPDEADVGDGGSGTENIFPPQSTVLLAGDDGDVVPQVMLYLGTTIILGSGNSALPLEIRAGMMEGSRSVVLTITPSAAKPVNLQSLTALMGDNIQELYAQVPSDLQQYLNAIQLQSFSAGFTPTNSQPLSYVQAMVGTSPPWPLFPPLNSLTLNLNWLVQFTGNNANTIASFEAIFHFNGGIDFDVIVILPAVIITGVQHGPPVTLSLSEIAKTLFGGSFPIPDDLLVFQFSGFNIYIDYYGKKYSFGAVASLSFNLFGTQILGLKDMSLQVTVDCSKPTTSYTGILNGYLFLGSIQLQVNATLSNTADCVFEMHLVNETLGSMINHLIHLVDPTFDLSLDAPWNKLLAISLDAFVLKVNVTKKIVSLTYNTKIELGFMTISGISLTYQKSATVASSVQISLSGTFLGQSVGQDGKPPLAWDAMNQQPPAVPGAGSSMLDLQYVGLGQHITFTDLDKLTTVGKVMTAMINSVIPTNGKSLPPLGQNGLAFDKDSNWLIGAQFTVMGTVSLSIIFNDPNLYGLLISLAGERAKSLAGLSFEILYRKVTDSIGVYHIELKLPDAMRNLQFGSVALTLPIITLDIYTNGNFRVDFGFPQGMDFSRSFCLQIFPFIGYGGFYFALLNGQTSTRVPQITNGNFNPVIEFGIGLSVGVGKTIDAGILSGGISVTVVGILEGVIGWFNPNDAAVSKEEYYWLQGTIAIVGKLYATIDFAIIKADINVTAYASVTFIIEAHQPIYINLVAGVTVRVSVKIIFFTIHLSFSAQIKASFTIGSATPTPWQVASSSASARALLRQLPGQDTLHHPQSRFAGLTAALRAQRAVRMLETEPPLQWKPVPVFPDGKTRTVDLYALPSFTKSETIAGGVNAVLLLCLENSIAPDAVTLSDHRQLYGDDPAAIEFNLLLQGMLYWAIYARRQGDNSIVTADDLAYLKAQLARPETTQEAFNYTNLAAFFVENFRFVMHAPPASNGDADADAALGVTVFPMFPSVTASGQTLQTGLADDNYQAKINVYFNLLQVQYKQGTAPDRNGMSAEPLPQASAEDVSVSMATIVFEQYFGMLASAAVNAAVDLLAQYSFKTTAPASIPDIINGIGDETLTPMQVVMPNQSNSAVLNTGTTIALNNVLYQTQSGDSFASIAAGFNKQGALGAQDQPLQAADVATANGATGGMFILNTAITFSSNDATNPDRIVYLTQAGDTLNLVAARLLVRAAPASLLQQLVSLEQFTQEIIGLNLTIIVHLDGTLPPGVALNIPNQTNVYTTVAGDTFMLVASYFLAMQQQVVAYQGFVAVLLGINTLQVTDPTAPQPVGTSLNIPAVTRQLQAVDTIDSLAVTLITTPAIIQAWLLSAPGNLLTPQSVLNLPALRYKLAAGDTLSGIAQKFNMSLAQLADDLMEPVNPADPTTIPKIFALGASVIVNDVESIGVETLMAALLNQGEWNNIAGMVSRFLLNGLRLPDPNDAYFASLTVAELENPADVDFTKIVTQPMYALTGQQFAIKTAPPPADLTLTNSQPVVWLLAADGTSEFTEMQLALTAQQQTLIGEIAGTNVNQQIQSLTRLELFQMVPPRYTLQQHMHWQAAVLPASPCFSQTAQATGGPSLRLFPDALVTKLTSGAAEQLKYELVVGTHEDATKPMTIADVSCYNWATMLDLSVSLPQVDGATPAALANGYVMLGADENGRDLLQQLYTYLTETNPKDQATLYLLYSPNPSSTNASGFISDKLDPVKTFLLKTNLSTLSHSGPTFESSRDMAEAETTDDATDGAPYDVTLADPADFIKLLWECSIVNSGGYYLNYVNTNGNSGLPGELFAQGQTCTVSLLVLLASQGTSAHPPIYSFNNCAVVGDNIDASQANLFVQPVVYVVPQGDSFASVVGDYNANSGAALTVAQVAGFNATMSPLLLVGATLEVVNQGVNESYTIGVSDTLASIALKFNIKDVPTLIAIGHNAQAPILTRGLQINLSDPATPNHVTEPVPAGDSLSDAANFYNANYGGTLTALDVASLNADIQLLLLLGAQLQISNQPNYEIQYGDTLASIAAHFKSDVRTLASTGHNASAAILAPGAQAQFNQGILQPAATVPPGNVGFALTCTNPDPYNAPYAQLTAQQVVNSLFHLLAYSIAASAPAQDAPGFMASGAGLPAGPANSNQDNSNGSSSAEPADGVELEWYYQQTLAVAPFATSAQGSVSAALPPAKKNPYAGIGPLNQVKLSFILQDLYGNKQPLPAQYDQLSIPVSYYIDIIALNRWPGMACAYEVLSGTQPQIRLQLNMQFDKYLPSASVSVESAQQSVAADLASYTQVYYQIQQSDLNFALETSLDTTSLNSHPPIYPINPKTPFTAFVNAACIFLSALQTLKQFVYTCGDADTVTAIVNSFGVTAAQLFDAHADTTYSDLFGQSSLFVPVMYAVKQNDTLSSISAGHGQTPLTLANNNADVALNPGVALVAPNRPYKVHDGYTLEQIAVEWRCTIEGLAEANHDVPNILQPLKVFTVNNVSLPVGPEDTFDSMVLKFAANPGQPVLLTVAELAAAVAMTVPGIFIDKVTLKVTDIVIQQGDASPRPAYKVHDNYSLLQVADELNLSVIGIALANHNLRNILRTGVELSANNVSLAVGPNDTFDSMAQALAALSKLPVTVADLAVVNQKLPGIFRDAAVLRTTQQGDSFNSLANNYTADGFTIEVLADNLKNQVLPDIFAAGTPLFIKANQIAPEPGDKLSDYASNNGVTLDELAAHNSTATFVKGAKLKIPSLVLNQNAQQYSSYSALETDTLGGIADKFPNLAPAQLATLNQDIQGLFATGQTITDQGSQKSVTTGAGDTFNSLLAKFAAENVTLTLAELAADIETQQKLVQPLGVWLTPAMVAANSVSGEPQNSLVGLAAKYNLDAGSLALANSAAQGFLAGDISLTYEGQTLTTKTDDTFNSLVNRFQALGFAPTVADLAAAFANLPGLLNPASFVVPLPAPTQTTINLTPRFSDAIFPLSVDVVMRRDRSCVDPDFANVVSVYESRTPIAPEATPSASTAALSLVDFAKNFESALPGLHVASGKATSENDTDADRRLWVVNFGNSTGQQLNYKFGSGAQLQFFAVPPLSTSLISDTAQITPYVSGVGLSGPAQTMNFQSIDLDVWASTFLQAVDLFLSPAYAIPAYALQTTPAEGQKLTPYEQVVAQKGVLAEAISEQVEYILQQTADADALKDAKAALKQALLVELSSAYSINSLVQVPVVVKSNYSQANLAPRLSGKAASTLQVTGATNAAPIVITSPQHNLSTGDVVLISGVLGNTAANGTWTVTRLDTDSFSLNGSSGTGSQPYVPNSGTITVETTKVNDYSLSTAKVPLVNGTDRATFLFTVKSPADNKQANMALQYVINQLEVPTAGSATIDDYQPSNWLTFILPLADQNSAIGQATIPIPLRSYPSPLTLVSQTATQTYPAPTSVTELVAWDYAFVYQHLDADQDTTNLKVQFNSGSQNLRAMVNEPGLFDALAQFIAVYPQLKDDLALLPLVTLGAPNSTALVAVQTFSQLVEAVAKVWSAPPVLARASAGTQATYYYQLQRRKKESNPSELDKLIITAQDDNPGVLWPGVEVYVNGEFQALMAELMPPGSKQAIYDYPSGVLADNSLQYRFTFPQLNVTATQDGWAGVSITRNANLIQNVQTNPDFIYQTPITSFSSVIIPFIYGDANIDIKNPPAIGMAQALGQFFQVLLSCNPDLPAGTTRNIRVACNYGYQLAAPGTTEASAHRGIAGLRATGNNEPLVAFIPVILIPTYPFDLSKSYNWNDPQSFVSLLADDVTHWQKDNSPATTNGAFFFDVSLYSTLDPSNLQPLMEAPFVRYVLD